MKPSDIYTPAFIHRNGYLKNYEFIGGWTEGEKVNLWYRDNLERKVVTIDKVPRYFCVTADDFKRLSEGQLTEWKSVGLFNRGKILGNYAYFFLGDTQQSVLDDWYTLIDNLGVKPLEGDVKRHNRLMIDMGWKVASLASKNPPRVAFYDIETDDRNNKISAGEDRILSVAWKELDTGNEYFEVLPEDTDEAEYKFLIKVASQLVKYDILVGYNNYGFDDICFEGKFKYHRISQTVWRRIEKLDFFNLLERQGTFRQYGAPNRKLDTISKAVIGRGKIEHTEKIYELWANNKELLREYNIEDVRLIHDMEKKLSSVGLVISLCSLSGLLHSSNYSPAKVVDTFLLRYANERREKTGVDFRYPTAYYRPEHKLGGKHASPFTRNALAADRRKGREEELAEMGIEYEPVEGALVLESEPGLYTNVSAFDFNSLYPSTIIAFNIGPDTLCQETDNYPKNKAPNDVYYRTDFISNMAAGVEHLLAERKKIKSEMKNITDPIIYNALDIQQRAVKETTNSFYGVTAQWGGRYYSKQIAESITSTGRYFLHFAEKHFPLHNAKVVLGDTDSVYISLPNRTDDSVGYKDSYETALRASLQAEFNCFRPDVFKMAFEKRATKVFLIGKKNYAMHLDTKDGEPANEIIYKGLQVVKGNMCRWAANILKPMIEDILKYEYGADHYERILENAKNQIINADLYYTDLLISARLGKPLSEYSGEALPHVRIAKRLSENGKLVPEYSTISYLVTNGAVPISAISDDEFLETKEQIDGVYYYNTALLQVAEKYLSVVFPDIDWWGKFAFPNNTKRKPFSLKIVPKH